MQKLLLLLVVFIPCFVFAQISIDQGDMPQEGDTIRTSAGVDSSGIDFTATGENFIWDFTSVTPIAQNVDSYVSVSQTPFVYQIVFFLSANLARELMEFDQFPGFEVTDTYEYFKNSSSDFRSVGYGVTLNGLPIPNKFQEPDKIYQFPVNYSNKDSSFSSYEISVPGMGYLGGWKKRVNHADGWGELKSPYCTFDVLRLSSEISQYDSLFIDSLGIGFPLSRNYTEYKWLGENQGIPLFQVNVEGPLQTITYIDSVRNLFVGVEEVQVQNGFSMFPNPATHAVIIELPFAQKELETITLIGLDGLAISIDDFSLLSDNRLKINLTSFQSGVYLMKITTSNDSFVERLLIR